MSLKDLKLPSLDKCHIVTLELRNAQLTAQDCSHIASSFLYLKSLDLSCNPQIGAKGFSTLMKAKFATEKLENLTMFNCNITSQLSVVNHLCEMKSVNLSHNPLRSGATKLVKHLPTCLETLCLVNCEIAAVDIFTLVGVLPRQELAELDLSHNPGIDLQTL